MYIKLIFWFSLIANLIDGLATWFFVCYLKVANELNPIMAAVIDVHPMFFLVVKILFGSVAIIFMYKFVKRSRRALIGLYTIFVVYAVITLVHCVNLGMHLQHVFG